MKKKIMLPVLLLAFAPKLMAQCEEPAALPYMPDIESVVTPSLPQCMASGWESFSSQEVFESIPGPVPGFTGQLLAYDTTIDTEFGMPANAWVRGNLYTPQIYLQQGTAYTVSFRYANSDPNLTIGRLSVVLNGVNGEVEVDALENITGATATDYISVEFTPPSNGNYYIKLMADSEGTQGQLYLDDIAVRSTGIMGTNDKTLSGLSIYPNPAKSIVTLSNNTLIDSFELYNTAGQLVLTEKPNKMASEISIGALPSGVYIARVASGGGSEQARIIKE